MQNAASQPPLQPAYDGNQYTADDPVQDRRTKRSSTKEKIDPKQIPRPAELSFGESNKFFTRSGSTPPPTTSEFMVVDDGNCSPRFVRLTTNNIADDADLIESTKLCIGAIIQPLADMAPGEEAIRIVDYPEGPLRCDRCRGYVNPFFKFIDGGQKFICNLCGTTNDVPVNYQCNLDANGLRRDRNDRPELCRGSVEFAAGPEFLLREVQDPCYLFVLDVSFSAGASGLINMAIDTIRSALDVLAYNPRVRVGIITYDSVIQFYSMSTARAEPSIMVVTDVDEVFVPCPADEMLMSVGSPQGRELLEGLLDLLSSIYDAASMVPPAVPQHCGGAAVYAACEALKDLGGKVLFLQSNLPSVGMGKLSSRDSGDLYNTDKENTLWVPQHDFYQTLANSAAEHAVTVDLYVCANSYIDLATQSALVNTTGGQVYVYPGFNANKDAEALQGDLLNNLTRNTGFDAIMVVRTSAGLKVAEYYGNYYSRRPHELDLPSIDSDKAFGIRLEHEGKLEDKSEACMQVALLYTTAEGHRRIRVHTHSAPVTSVMSNIFRHSDLDTVVNLSMKQAVKQFKTGGSSLAAAQLALTEACIESLFVYRKFCATATSAGQLILPEPLKLLPLYTLGLIKNPLLQPGLAADQRSFLFSSMYSMPTYVSVAVVCPRLFNLTTLPQGTCIVGDDGRVHVPPSLTLSSQSVRSDGLYLLDNGYFQYMLVGEHLEPSVLASVFGIDPNTAYQGQVPYRVVAEEGNPMATSSRVRLLIESLRKNKPFFQNFQVISRMGQNRVESLDEGQFFSHMIEDGPKGGDHGKQPCRMSYVDFLCHIHKKIQKKFY